MLKCSTVSINLLNDVLCLKLMLLIVYILFSAMPTAESTFPTVNTKTSTTTRRTTTTTRSTTTTITNKPTSTTRKTTVSTTSPQLEGKLMPHTQPHGVYIPYC